jgi:hypothetical protein
MTSAESAAAQGCEQKSSQTDDGYVFVRKSGKRREEMNCVKIRIDENKMPYRTNVSTRNRIIFYYRGAGA